MCVCGVCAFVCCLCPVQSETGCSGCWFQVGPTLLLHKAGEAPYAQRRKQGGVSMFACLFVCLLVFAYFCLLFAGACLFLILFAGACFLLFCLFVLASWVGDPLTQSSNEKHICKYVCTYVAQTPAIA